MAVTVAITDEDKGFHFGTINLGVYATGGVAITPGTFDYGEALVDLDVSASGGTIFQWDDVNSKIKAYQNAAGAGPLAEVANATNLTAVVSRFRSFGY
jgi:hypothetical protein